MTTASGNLFPEAVSVWATGGDHRPLSGVSSRASPILEKTKALVPIGTKAFCKRFLCRNY